MLVTTVLPSSPVTVKDEPDDSITVIIIVVSVIGSLIIIAVGLVMFLKSGQMTRCLKISEKGRPKHLYRERIPNNKAAAINGFDHSLHPSHRKYYVNLQNPLFYKGQPEGHTMPEKGLNTKLEFKHNINPKDMRITGFDHALRPEHRRFHLEVMENNGSESTIYKGMSDHSSEAPFKDFYENVSESMQVNNTIFNGLYESGYVQNVNGINNKRQIHSSNNDEHNVSENNQNNYTMFNYYM